jgi:hypothetical protein
MKPVKITVGASKRTGTPSVSTRSLSDNDATHEGTYVERAQKLTEAALVAQVESRLACLTSEPEKGKYQDLLNLCKAYNKLHPESIPSLKLIAKIYTAMGLTRQALAYNDKISYHEGTVAKLVGPRAIPPHSPNLALRSVFPAAGPLPPIGSTAATAMTQSAAISSAADALNALAALNAVSLPAGPAMRTSLTEAAQSPTLNGTGVVPTASERAVTVAPRPLQFPLSYQNGSLSVSVGAAQTQVPVPVSVAPLMTPHTAPANANANASATATATGPAPGLLVAHSTLGNTRPAAPLSHTPVMAFQAGPAITTPLTVSDTGTNTGIHADGNSGGCCSSCTIL